MCNPDDAASEQSPDLFAMMGINPGDGSAEPKYEAFTRVFSEEEMKAAEAFCRLMWVAKGRPDPETIVSAPIKEERKA